MAWHGQLSSSSLSALLCSIQTTAAMAISTSASDEQLDLAFTTELAVELCVHRPARPSWSQAWQTAD